MIKVISEGFARLGLDLEGVASFRRLFDDAGEGDDGVVGVVVVPDAHRREQRLADLRRLVDGEAVSRVDEFGRVVVFVKNCFKIDKLLHHDRAML